MNLQEETGYFRCRLFKNPPKSLIFSLEPDCVLSIGYQVVLVRCEPSVTDTDIKCEHHRENGPHWPVKASDEIRRTKKIHIMESLP